MSNNHETFIIFAGKKLTTDEFIEMYGLDDENDETIQVIMDKLEKKGKLRYIEEDFDNSGAFKSVAKELDLESKIAQIEADAESEVIYKQHVRKEGRLSYEEVEIDFPSLTAANDFKDFAVNKLHVKAHVEERDGIQTLVLKDITESDLGIIKRRKGFTEAGNAIFKTTDKVAETAVQATAFTTEKVVVPATKATVKATAGLAKSLVKTTAQVGSSLITSTAQSTRSMKEELSKDEDVLRARKEIVDAKDAVMRLFNRGGKGGSGVRIK